MTPPIKALIVDDDPSIIESVGDIVRSLDHAADTAGDIETAKRLLAERTYAYLILDMKIPISADRNLGRRENGRNLIQVLRANPATVNLPIIVITGEDHGQSSFILSVIVAGGLELTAYIQKPIDGDELDCAIQKMLTRGQAAASALAPTSPPPSPTGPPAPQPFHIPEGRQLDLHQDRIVFLGAEVWHDTGQDTSARDTCALLSLRDAHGYVRRKGPALAEILGRGPSNPIGTPLNRLLDRCVEVATGKGLACQRADLIACRMGGYHFTETMRVSIIGDWAEPLGVGPKSETVLVLDAGSQKGPPMSERQLRIRELKAAGETNEHIARKLKISRATVVRESRPQPACD